MSTPSFNVALTGDFYGPDGQPRYRDLGLGRFDPHSRDPVPAVGGASPGDRPRPARRRAGRHRPDARGDGETVSPGRDLLAIGRFGVGYDAVDVPACTAADVAVFITAGAVDRLGRRGHRRLDARADAQRPRPRTGSSARGGGTTAAEYMGRELRDRTLGVDRPRGHRPGRWSAARRVRDEAAAGVRSVPRHPPTHEPSACGSSASTSCWPTADFVSIHCPLTDQTRSLIGARELGLMKPDAYLINTARGGIVDEDALYEALAGAPDRRGGPRLLRRGAGHGAAPVRRARQRAAGPALHRLDRRAVPRHRPHGVPGDARPVARRAAARRGQSRGLRPARLPGEVDAVATSGGQPSSGRLEGQTAWISGAASGIGEAAARLFAAEGANVALVDVQADARPAAGAPSVAARRPGPVRRPPTSASRTEVRSIVDEAGRAVRRPEHRGQLRRGSSTSAAARVRREADWDRLMGVNVKSIFFAVKHGLSPPATQPAELRGERRLDQQLRRPGATPAYTASKAAVLGLSRSIALDYAATRPALQLRLPRHHRHADAAAITWTRRPTPDAALADRLAPRPHAGRP